MSMKVPMKGYSRVSISISWHKYLVKIYRSCSTIKTTGNQWELTFDTILWGSVCPHKDLPWNDLSPFCFAWWFVLLSPWKIFRERHSWHFNTGSGWLQWCRGRLERCWEVKMESWTVGDYEEFLEQPPFASLLLAHFWNLVEMDGMELVPEELVGMVPVSLEEELCSSLVFVLLNL